MGVAKPFFLKGIMIDLERGTIIFSVCLVYRGLAAS